MSKKSDEYWFKSKKYGWGWGMPNSRNGWLSFGLFFVVWLAALAWYISAPIDSEVNGSGELILLAVIIADVIGLIFVSFKYGEPPKWRWGTKHDSRKS